MTNLIQDEINKIKISPSLICADLCNLEHEIKKIESLGIDLLHIDIIDSTFSPSMPIGIEIIKQLRKKTNIKFDVHLMTNNNEFFIHELIDLEIYQLSFHIESTLHADRLLRLLQKNNIRPGIALNPATPLTTLEYIIEICDFILLMLINPGYAGFAGEKQVPYSIRKIKDCYRFIRKNEMDIPIEVDGRVSLESIPSLVEAGADILVAGSTSLFIKNNEMKHNLSLMQQAIADGMMKRSRN